MDETEDFAQITLTLDKEGSLMGSLKWSISEDTPPEHAEYMVEALHGMFSVLMNDPKYTTELGAAFLLGATSKEMEEDNLELFPEESIDKEDSSEQDDLVYNGKVISFKPSNRKH